MLFAKDDKRLPCKTKQHIKCTSLLIAYLTIDFSLVWKLKEKITPAYFLPHMILTFILAVAEPSAMEREGVLLFYDAVLLQYGTDVFFVKTLLQCRIFL
jgi:hypothetical protein